MSESKNELNKLIQCLVALFGWPVGALALYITVMRLGQRIWGAYADAKLEVLSMMFAGVVIGMATFVVVKFLKKHKLKVSAITIIFISLITGLYGLYLIFAFGGFHALVN